MGKDVCRLLYMSKGMYFMKVTRNEGNKGIPTAMIFSCPGQEEMKSGLLVNGQTGKNLDLLLSILKKSRPDLFPSVNRYDYRITNSSENVHFKAHDNRTEPSLAEVREKENIDRLKEDIKGYKCVIAFGRCAAAAADILKADKDFEGVSFINCQHLSFLSLNSSIKTDIEGAPIERGCENGTYKRLEVVAAKINDQINYS